MRNLTIGRSDRITDDRDSMCLHPRMETNKMTHMCGAEGVEQPGESDWEAQVGWGLSVTACYGLESKEYDRKCEDRKCTEK